MSEMKPGRELDALVASKVMGYEIVYSGADYYAERTYSPIPEYSTDIAAAWEVVEKVISINIAFEIGNIVKGDTQNWMACFNTVDWEIKKRSESAPHAICLAALKAVKGELDE